MYYTDDSEELVEELPKPNKVRDKIYIGCYQCASNLPALKSLGITHILNLMGGAELFPQNFTYMMLNLVDSASQDLLSYLPQCMEFVERAMQDGTGILIHCAAGISRSGAVTVAYLMYADNIPLEPALQQVKRARPVVHPNCGFTRQLGMWHEMGFTLRGSTAAHRVYKLEKLAAEFRCTKKVPPVECVRDPECRTVDCHSHYACSKCGRKLFLDGNIIPHEKGVGRLGCRFFCSNQLNCDFYFVEPIEWMGSLDKETGQLCCPNQQCGEIIGSWTWSDIECSCLSVVSPAFCIKKESVAVVHAGTIVQISHT
jgi:dual specificity phosphatase 12